MVNKSSEIVKSYTPERGGKKRHSSILELAIANIALTSVMFGALYFISNADKKNVEAADNTGEAPIENGLSEDSLAVRQYGFLVNVAHAMTKGTKIEISNGDYAAVHTDEEYSDDKPKESSESKDKNEVDEPVTTTENAPKPEVKPEAPEKPTPKTTEGLSEAEAKAYIYRRESGNRLDAVNPYGCIGLGQDCNSRLHIQCPDWQTNRKCQDEFWESYMKRRYGTWNKAKSHWDARVPINGVDRGHWW